MTRKEAREIIEIIDKVYCTLDKEERQALAVAIQALEQGSIIDKIRAEIEDMETLVTKFEVLDIIEKYGAESEG